MQANLANDDGGAIRLLMVDGRRRSQTGERHTERDPPLRRPHQHPQQHDREQRLDARGRRHRTRRLDQRRGRQQHGRAQHHDGDRDDEHRRAGTRRALDGRQQLPAAGRAGQALRGQLPPALLQADALQQRVHRQPLRLVVAHAGPPRHRPGRRSESHQPLGRRAGGQPLRRVGQRPPLPLAAEQPVRHHGATTRPTSWPARPTCSAPR